MGPTGRAQIVPRGAHNDGGRSTGIDYKGVGSKPPAGAEEGNFDVLNGAGKGEKDSSGKYKETNANEPLMTRRKSGTMLKRWMFAIHGKSQG